MLLYVFVRNNACALLLGIAMTCGCTVQTGNSQTPTDHSLKNAPLRKFLQNYLGSSSGGHDKDLHVLIATVPLSGPDAKQVLVYINSRDWCGSGGCTMLVLTPSGSTYKVVSRITIVNLPIRVLRTNSHGWHDLSVVVRGGGILQAYEAKLSFNGKKYADNPTVPPVTRSPRKAEGTVAISDTSEQFSLVP
jgi:hypothetical protein